MKTLPLQEFLDSDSQFPIIDVRSEGEHLQGCIPGSINIPLLNNEERRLVGICYKERGNEGAVILGYELVAKKFSLIIKQIRAQATQKAVRIHCWRGGLRSRIVAQMLDNAGFQVYILEGGYKSYRHRVLEQLNQPYQFLVLGGFTGSGKTALLHLLKAHGEQVIDLEGLANHKGSALGGIGQPPQPTQEQFENYLCEELNRLNPNQPTWIEDESRKIGSITLPLKIWEAMRIAHWIMLDIPFEQRLSRVVHEYGTLPVEKLEERCLTLRKRLGDLQLRIVLDLLKQGDIRGWAAEMLHYYDKSYAFGQSQREFHSMKKIKLEEPYDPAVFLKLLDQ